MYFSLLKEAFSMVWNHKRWLFLGLFITLLGSGGVYEAVIQIGGDRINSLGGEDSFWQNLLKSPWAQGEFWKNTVFGFFSSPENVFIAISPFIIAFVFLLLLAMLVVFAQIALIKCASAAEEGKEEQIRGNKAAIRPSLLPALAVHLCAQGAISASLSILGSLLYSSIMLNASGNTIFFVLILIISIVSAMFFSFAAFFAIVNIVLNGKKFVSSLKYGILFAKKHLLTNLEMGAILFCLSIISFLLVFFVGALLSLPFYVLMAVFLSQNMSTLAIGAGIIIILMVVSAALFFVAFFSTFQTVVWTLYWKKLKHGVTFPHITNFFKPK